VAFAVTEEWMVAKRATVGEEAADIQALVATPEGETNGEEEVAE
jgi:hypothetical protein